MSMSQPSPTRNCTEESDSPTITPRSGTRISSAATCRMTVCPTQYENALSMMTPLRISLALRGIHLHFDDQLENSRKNIFCACHLIAHAGINIHLGEGYTIFRFPGSCITMEKCRRMSTGCRKLSELLNRAKSTAETKPACSSFFFCVLCVEKSSDARQTKLNTES